MFVTIAGTTLHYQVEGAKTGTPIVFLNSLGSSLCIWDEVAARLGKSHPILRYDKAGHGLSDCPPAAYSLRDHSHDLLGLLDHLRIERAVLVGVSVGGMIALDFAASYAQRVQKLVLCDTGAKIGTAQSWNDRIAAVESNGLAAIAQAVLARWFTADFIQNQPAQYQGYANMLVRTPAQGYVATCAALRDGDLRTVVPGIQIPALVLCGDEDLATPPTLGQELASTLANASFALIEKAGHLPSIEQPSLLAEKILAFL